MNDLPPELQDLTRGLIPRPLAQEHWHALGVATGALGVFVALVLAGVLALALVRLVVPALAPDDPAETGLLSLRHLRRALYGIGAAALLAAAWALATSLAATAGVLRHYFPRFLI